MSVLARVCIALNRAVVRYAVAGGYAVALHGAVRGTLDVDIVIDWTQAALAAVEQTLAGLGLVSRLPVSAADVFAPGRVRRAAARHRRPDRHEAAQRTPAGPRGRLRPRKAPMRALQLFSDEYLARCRGLPPDAIVRFLEDFRILHGRRWLAAGGSSAPPDRPSAATPHRPRAGDDFRLDSHAGAGER